MKTYEVEIKRESFVTVTVEANNVDEAEVLAWQRVNDDSNVGYANWTLESIEEMKGESK